MRTFEVLLAVSVLAACSPGAANSPAHAQVLTGNIGKADYKIEIPAA